MALRIAKIITVSFGRLRRSKLPLVFSRGTRIGSIRSVGSVAKKRILVRRTGLRLR